MLFQNAGVAVEFDCKSQPARLKPERQIPWDQRGYQRSDE
jgi:hypothetical protein